MDLIVASKMMMEKRLIALLTLKNGEVSRLKYTFFEAHISDKFSYNFLKAENNITYFFVYGVFWFFLCSYFVYNFILYYAVL